MIRFSLADIYNADVRSVHTDARQLAAKVYIPHPLNGVQYADGISPCRHAKEHTRWEACGHEVRPATPRFSSQAGLAAVKESPGRIPVDYQRPLPRDPEPQGPFVCSHIEYDHGRPVMCEADALPDGDRCEQHPVADPDWGWNQ
ncbi:hypothetical protein [Ruania rhizosphaerae]|uniref:hypothetical protein n=1 Tax=Ruania rhizosphaerae TaxID=1840413 RepID=UPI0013587043|nr:hypothetical protein [Ruania rhizosphaerae]